MAHTETPNPQKPRTRGVLLDIEGTTTPVSFVYETLFPFARERLDETCARAGEEPEIARAVEELRAEYAAEDAADELPAFADGAPYARYLMDHDRKSTGLKRLQGILWRRGYDSGELAGEVFADVPPALERWRAEDRRLRIFSSGSVLAQKLLFSTTAHGDLTAYFEGFHDTTTGPKKEPESYREIAAAFALEPGAVLFLSDVVAELDAARAAGMSTGLLKRPGNPPAEAGGHPEYADFNEIELR